jgi:hypothetical protein
MGIDISNTVGVGFVIDEDVWEEWVAKSDLDGYGEEYLHDLFRRYPELGYAEGANYWSGDSTERVITVERLTFTVDAHDGRVHKIGNSLNLTREEGIALLKFAEEIGQDEPEIITFVAVLVS